MEAWKKALEQVDDTPVPELVDNLAKKLVDGNWSTPESIVGCSVDDLVASLGTLSPQEKAFAKRTLEDAELKAQVRKQLTLASQSTAPQPQQQQQQLQVQAHPDLTQELRAILGNEASALRVADALAAGGGGRPDIGDAMKKIGLSKLPDSFNVEQDVYFALHLDNAAAKKSGRTVAFTYIELTSQAVLPIYMPPEAVGGKTSLASDEVGMGGYSGNLAQLGQALKSLTSSVRCFRTMSQWSTAFIRYSVAAMAMEQVTLDWVVCHQQMVMRIAIEETTMVAILYDELQRKAWARRSSRGDSSLNLIEEVTTKSLSSLELAKSRVKIVAETAGLTMPDAQYNAAGSSSGLETVSEWKASAESAIGKQAAAADQLKR